jgi:cytochrome c-type biogenesis protein CcmH/NrfF
VTRRAAALALALVLALAAPAAAQQPRASLPDIEDEVMCVTCNVALNIAESPQASRQRAFIRQLIDDGLTKRQIKARLVDEYGEDVLALPEEEGVGVAAYAVPIGVVLALAATLALVLPRWRNRGAGRGGGGAPAGAAPVSDADLRRLDEDLARFDRGG